MFVYISEVADPDDEEGEVIRPEDRDKYDINKIISYPGFNVPPSSKISDVRHSQH